MCEIVKGRPEQIGANLPEEIFPYRGKYVYGDYREFFTPDLIEDYSRSRVSGARYYIDRKNYPEARHELEAALSFQPFFPQVYNLLAYSYVAENSYPAAENRPSSPNTSSTDSPSSALAAIVADNSGGNSGT